METPGPLTYEEVRRQADGLVSNGQAPEAAALYERFVAACDATDPRRTDAVFELALLEEQALGRSESAVDRYIQLYEGGHEGATKALERILDAARQAAQETDVRRDPGPVEALGRLLGRLPGSLPGRVQSQEVVARLWPQAVFGRANAAYDAHEYGRAAGFYQEAARAAGPGPFATAALGRAAAILWHQMKDGPEALGTLAGIPAGSPLPSEVAHVLGKVLDGLQEQLSSLVRRGDRRGAYEMVGKLMSAVPGDSIRADDLREMYLRELSSFYLTFVVDRVDAVTRRIDGVSGELARKTAQGRADRVDEVEARWRLFALNEEREMLLDLRKQLRSWELALLTRLAPETYLDLLESSRKDGSFRELLDLLHRLSLERMHYRIGFRSEVKDRLLSLLPGGLSRRLVDDVYLKVREITLEIERRRRELYERVYGPLVEGPPPVPEEAPRPPPPPPPA